MSRFRNSRRRGPPNRQGIFIPVVIRDQTNDLESLMQIEGLRTLIGLSYLCPYFFDIGDTHRSFKEFCANAFSPMVRMDCNGDNVTISGEDDIPQDPTSSGSSRTDFFVTGRVDIDKKGFTVEMVKIDEGRPVVRGLGKGLGFDLENLIKVREGEDPDHWCLLVPSMMEAMPPVNLRDLTFSNPTPLIIFS